LVGALVAVLVAGGLGARVIGARQQFVYHERSSLAMGTFVAMRAAGPRAPAALDEARELGLVHSVSNMVEGVNYVCNCCGCCCGILRGITEFGLKSSVACANYFAVVDPAECTSCGVCADRCQVGAISLGQDLAEVDRNLCLGCGVCVTGCATGAVRLQIKPEEEIVHPPPNLGSWERLRKADRGLA